MQLIKKILFLAFMILVLESNVLTVQASSFKFNSTVEEEEVKIGDTIKIDMQISDIDVKEGINVVEANLEYDETIFESVAFEDLNDWTSIYNIEKNTKKGKFIMAKAVEGVKKQETIGRIQFKLKDNLKEMETEIKINNITSNNGIELMDEGNRNLKIKIINKEEAEQKGQQNLVQTTYEQNNSEDTNNEKNKKADSIIPKSGDNIKTGDRILLIVVAGIILITINLIYFIVKVRQLKKDKGIEKHRTKMIILSIISFLLLIIVLCLAKDVFAFEEKNIEEMIQSLKNENENNPESKEYLITDQTISRIKPETTVQMLESKLQNVKVLNHIGIENLKTGMILEYKENKRTYEISVLGDINGDGIANQIELTREIRECLKCKDWRIEKEVEKLSADINCDKKIDQKDISSLINYIVYGKLEVKEVESIIKPKIEVLSGKEVEEGRYISSVTVKITQENEDTKTEKTMYKITGSKTTEEKEIDNKEEVIELTEPGVYKITSYTYGIDGNKSKTSDLIIVIEEVPEIKITPETWTNENVKVLIEGREGYEREYKIDNGQWTKYEGEFEIEENCTITARLIKQGNEMQKSREITKQITNIDRVTPTGNIEKIQKRANVLRVKVRGQDQELSGIDRIRIYVKEETQEEYNCVKTYKYEANSESYALQEEIYDIEGLKAETSYKIYTEVEDKAGNVYSTRDNELELKTLKEPDLTIKTTPVEWTKDNVTATIEIPDEYKEEGYHIEYVLSQGKKPEETEGWITYPNESTIIIKENTTIYARLAKEEIKEKIVTKKISNIDKKPPVDFDPIVTSTTNSITVTGNTRDEETTNSNDESGIDKYYFSQDNGVTWEPTGGQTQTSYTFENLVQNQMYSIKMNAVDNAGNERITKTINETTKTVPVLNESNIEFIYTDTNWTNKDYVGVSIKITDKSIKGAYTLEYSTDGITWNNYTETIKMYDNGKVYARVIDSTEQTGNNSITGYPTATVGNIDRIEPNSAIITLSSTTTEIGENITAHVIQSDKESNIDITKCKWVYTTNSEEIGTVESKYTGGIFSINPEDLTLKSKMAGTYYLHVLTIDQAGNKKETISEAVTIGTKIVPKIGDYVAYTPQNTVTSYKFEDKYTRLY